MANRLQRANAVLVRGISEAQAINVGTIEVLRNVTAVLVPLSVSVLPNRQRLVPAIDRVVARGYDTAVRLVEAQYDLALSALSRVGTAA